MAHFQPLHDWNLSPTEAVALQQQLRSHIRIEPLTKTPQTIAGCDISFNKFEETVYAGIVVLNIETLETIEEVGVVSTASRTFRGCCRFARFHHCSKRGQS